LRASGLPTKKATIEAALKNTRASSRRGFRYEPCSIRPWAIAAARNYRLLREKGITIRKTIDLIIGTFCIDEGHCLLHGDRDFEPMREHLGLRVISL
jgi:predicted nucleic acid-binding protein